MKNNHIIVEGNKPLLIVDNKKSYIVESGRVDIFLVKVEKGEAVGSRNFLFSVDAGDIVLGADFAGVSKIKGLNEKYGYMMVGTTNTQVSEHTTTSLIKTHKDRVDEFIFNISEFMPNASHESSKLKVGTTNKLSVGSIFRANVPVAWVEVKKGEVGFGTELIGAGHFFPVGKSPLRVTKDAEIVIHNNDKIVKDKNFNKYLTSFINIFIDGAIDGLALKQSKRFTRFKSKITESRNLMSNTIHRLLDIFSRKKVLDLTTISGEPHLAAAKAIGQVEDLKIVAPQFMDETYFKDPVKEIARSSRFMVRDIKLTGRWWEQDAGTIYGFLKGEKELTPIALVPRTPLPFSKNKSTYRMFDPLTKSLVDMDEKIAAHVAPDGYMIYKPFPNKELSLTDIFKFGLRKKTIWDMAVIMVVGMLMGIMGMFTPIVTGIIFSSVIPGAEYNSLAYITVFLVAIAITSSIFQITRSIATLRFEGRIDFMIQSAIWQRLLSLPVPFFKKYSSSDLSARANSIITIRQMLTGAAMSTILSAIFSLFQFFLLFYFSAKLASIAILLTILPVALVLISGKYSMGMMKKAVELQTKTSGMVLQLVAGISKFKIIGGEKRAFSLWGEKFYEQYDMQKQAGKYGGYISLFNGVYPILTSVVLFYFVGMDKNMQVGSFLAFQAAFSTFMGSLLGLASVAVSLLRVVPLYQRALPILQAIPEVTEQKKDPGKLSGGIEVKNVSFRYVENGPIILKDVSIEVKPGEFVAFVGGSGSGKSTLLRLLLGFNTQEEGSIYFDNYNMKDIDIQATRRQMGVVLQQGKLMTGDIFNNIIGPYNLTMDDAWAAARAAGLDHDVEDMPMDMHTVIPEGGGTLSGGQKQRVLIARAVVNKPQIIFFDEATSALDNKTQAVVTESLDKLDATKIVVAHRLSTIMGADKIYVFDKGVIVEVGNYAELMEKDGLFAELAKRQLA